MRGERGERKWDKRQNNITRRKEWAKALRGRVDAQVIVRQDNKGRDEKREGWQEGRWSDGCGEEQGDKVRVRVDSTHPKLLKMKERDN